jgi:hypothetical protein
MPQHNYPKRIHLFGGIMLLVCAVSILALVIGKEEPTKLYDNPVVDQSSPLALIENRNTLHTQPVVVEIDLIKQCPSSIIISPVPCTAIYPAMASPVPYSPSPCPLCGSIPAHEPLPAESLEFVRHQIAFVMFEETNTVQNAIGSPLQKDGAVLLGNLSADAASALLDTFGTMVNNTDKVSILTQPTVKSLPHTTATIYCGCATESFIIELRSYKSQDGDHIVTDVVLTQETRRGGKEESCRLELPTFSSDQTGLIGGSIGGKGFFLFVQTATE